MYNRLGIGTIRLHPWHRWMTYLILIVIAATGLAWTVMEDCLDLGPGPIPQLLLKTHGITSFLALMATGSLLPTHVRLSWRQRMNLGSGIIVSLMVLTLILSATSLYYGSEAWRDLTRWSHIITGMLIVLMLPLHIFIGRRRRLARHAAGRAALDGQPAAVRPDAPSSTHAQASAA